MDSRNRFALTVSLDPNRGDRSSPLSDSLLPILVAESRSVNVRAVVWYLCLMLTGAFYLSYSESGPMCTSNATNGNNVTLFCTVVYAESYIQPCNPIFTWINSSGAQVKRRQAIPVQIDAYTKRSRSHLSIARNDTTTYQCQMTFSAPPKSPLPYVAPTAPKFNASCSVSHVGDDEN